MDVRLGFFKVFRYPLASEEDTGYNMQFDPKNRVPSIHTSPEMTTHPIVSNIKHKKIHTGLHSETRTVGLSNTHFVYDEL